MSVSGEPITQLLYTTTVLRKKASAECYASRCWLNKEKKRQTDSLNVTVRHLKRTIVKLFFALVDDTVD